MAVLCECFFFYVRIDLVYVGEKKSRKENKRVLDVAREQPVGLTNLGKIWLRDLFSY